MILSLKPALCALIPWLLQKDEMLIGSSVCCVCFYKEMLTALFFCCKLLVATKIKKTKKELKSNVQPQTP